MMIRLLAVMFLGLATSFGCICQAQEPSKQPTPQPASDQRSKEPEVVAYLARQSDYFNVAPVYRVTIYADGSVEYVGMRNVKTVGTAKGSISQQDLKHLIGAFERANFFSLRDTYTANDGCPIVMSDSSSVYIWYQSGDKKKLIYHYLGCMDKSTNSVFPPRLYELEEMIDQLVHSSQWIN
jgi:hypothetical protein